MAKTVESKRLLARRTQRIRKTMSGTAERPRLRVRRTLKHIYVQVIDDVSGSTLLAASSVELKVNGGNIEGAKAVGKLVGEKAKQKSIDKVCFDRGGHLYHGRIKALAEAARETGLQF